MNSFTALRYSARFICRHAPGLKTPPADNRPAATEAIAVADSCRLQLDVHRFDLREQINRVFAVFAAEARLLVSAKGHAGVCEPVAVDPDGAGFERAGYLESAADIFGP